jgi:hypothetical protein
MVVAVLLKTSIGESGKRQSFNMKPTPWICGYCGHPQVVTDDNFTDDSLTPDHTELSELGIVNGPQSLDDK